MGENLDVPGRRSVRTPMQWSGEPNAGFSPAETQELRRPLVEGAYGPEHVNVTDQRREPESLLNWMERLVRRRKECPEVGWGGFAVVDADHPAVLAHRCDWEGRTMLAAHNLSPEPCRITLKLSDRDELVGMIDLLGTAGYQDLSGGGPVELELDAYGYRWLRVHRQGERLHV